ncbi:WhiB family transcriptional regulator [Streptomyces sp. NPDC002920]
MRATYAPDTLDRPNDWRAQAACARPEYKDRRDIWFAHATDTAEVALAKGICNAVCPVRRACLVAAMREEGGAALDRRHGIRGGMTGGERLGIYRRKKAAV